MTFPQGLQLPQRTRSLIGPILALLVVGSSCSIPVDPDAQAIDVPDSDELIHGTLLTPTTVSESEGTRFTLYFILDDSLQSVARLYPNEPPVNDLLSDLTLAPREDEVEQFAEAGTLRSLVPAELDPRLLSHEDETVGVVLVDPAGGLRSIRDEDPGKSARIVGQIVCTVINALQRVESVEIHEILPDGADKLPLVDFDVRQIENDRATAADFNDCATQDEAIVDTEGE